MENSLQRQTEEQDRFLHEELTSKFIGTAKVTISCLQFEAERTKEQFLRPQNIKRLKHIFATEGCHRLDRKNYIAALISASEFEVAVQKSGISQAALLRNTGEEPPKLEISKLRPLKFLHGCHRLQAASEFLSSDDDWWIVDLYLNGLCHNYVSEIFKTDPA